MQLRIRFGPDAFALFRGGVRRTAIELLDHLAAIGGDVSVLGAAEGIARGGRAPATADQRVGLQLNEARHLAGGERELSFSLYYDVSHSLAGRERAILVHDMTHERFGRRGALTRLKSLAVRRASTLIVPSNSSRADLLRILQPHVGIHVIEHGVGPQFLDPMRRAADHDRPYLLYVG